jgi:hypothetical protein
MVIEPHFTVSDQSLKHEIKLNLEATNRSDCFVVRELEARSLGVVGPSFSVHSLRNSACNIDNFCIFLNAESPLAPHWNAATDRLLIKNQEGGLDLILFQNANAAFKTTLISRADFVDHFRKDGSSGNF